MQRLSLLPSTGESGGSESGVLLGPGVLPVHALYLAVPVLPKVYGCHSSGGRCVNGCELIRHVALSLRVL